MPEPCPQCGKVPEGIIKIVEVLVETREQANEVLSNQNVDGAFHRRADALPLANPEKSLTV
jgi:hypothetical protein